MKKEFTGKHDIKVNENKKEVTIYAFTDQRQDYVNIIRGL